MSQLIRKVGGHEAIFTYQQKALLINITHPNKNEMLFGRIADSSFPQNLKDLSDNVLELFQFIKDLTDDKIVVSPKNELVLIIVMGKKTKQFGIQLERAQISNEQSLKKRIQDLEKQLEKKSFQAQFYKQQFNFLLKNLQLKPNIAQLQKLYQKQSISELFGEKLKDSRVTNSSVISNNSNKVMSAPPSQANKKEPFKCSKLHILVSKVTQKPNFRCNICRQMIPFGTERLRCEPCDFDACLKCSTIPPQYRKYCPQGHGLIFGSYGNYFTRACDLCRKAFKQQKGYSCVNCGYDVCKTCI